MTTPFPFVASTVLTAQQLNDIQNLPISDKTASYVLIAGDETKRTMMNSASATTITVNNSIFTVGDVIQVANKGAGTCTITAGAGVTINTSGTLALAQYGGGYLLALSASTFTFFNLGGGVSYGTATGGSSSSITVSSINYTLLTFTSDSNLVVSKAGLFDVLLFGGGAGGGGGQSGQGGGGGGGAGAKVQTTIYLDAATYAVDVAAGGAGGTNTNWGYTGAPSQIGSVINIIGGGAGRSNNVLENESQNMGCGGGGMGNSNGGRNLAGLSILTTGNGFNGGLGNNGANGGGGGGTGSVGAAGSVSGNGGTGFDVSAFIAGSALFKGGGGGAGGPTTPGTGGSSIGGNGGTVNGTAASANTASGGGGGNGATGVGGAGGSGIVYVRFKV
jgi:hypothetical protein